MPSKVVSECAPVVTGRGVKGEAIITMISLEGQRYWAFNGYIIPCTVPAGTRHIVAWRGRTCDHSHNIPIVDRLKKAAVHNTAASKATDKLARTTMYKQRSKITYYYHLLFCMFLYKPFSLIIWLYL
jgi:hypothetical protein